MTNDLILETGDELTAAQFKIEVFRLAALKCNIVLEALKVDLYSIAFLSSSVINSHDPDILLSQFVELLLNIFISYSIDNFFNLYTLVVLNFYLRSGGALSLKLNALFLADRNYLDLRLSNKVKT